VTAKLGRSINKALRQSRLRKLLLQQFIGTTSDNLNKLYAKQQSFDFTQVVTDIIRFCSEQTITYPLLLHHVKLVHSLIYTAQIRKCKELNTKIIVPAITFEVI